MAVLWAVAVLIWQIWVVVGQSYPSCSVSRELVLVWDALMLNSMDRPDAFQQLYLQHATARTASAFANKSIRQAY